MTHRAPIGVFDSGLGGLTVAAAIAARLPHERLLYLGDTARVPYGTRSATTVVRYALRNVRFLTRRGVALVVVACNTVSAHAMDALAIATDVPVLGVIKPGARAALAASKGGAIAVLGTPATIASDAYRRALHSIEPDREVISLACPLLVPLAEEGWIDHPVTAMVAREYLAPLAGTEVDTIILGCTHYPLLAPTLNAVAAEVLGREVALIDAAQAVAAAVEATLASASDAPRGPHHFFVTDPPDRAGPVAARFWSGATGDAAIELEHVDLDA